MRRKIIAGNWKMHGSRVEIISLLSELKEGVRAFASSVSVIVFPSFVYLQLVENQLVDSLIAWGGQNLYVSESGAFTGEVSGSMLVDYGCQYVLIGHSERRLLFHEDNKMVAEKIKIAIQSGLQPILCVGETQQQREQGQTEVVLAEQVQSVLHLVGIETFKQTIIAYEPVWAIGTGLAATPAEAQAGHEYIRNLLKKYSTDVANAVRILYGGSVRADNAAELFAQPDIDGALVGGASLNAKSFLAICQAATELGAKCTN
jgi:triosephosphate isomerase